jgi:phosphoribosylformylglycinamidine synthase subunit PurQ / glutaminase
MRFAVLVFPGTWSDKDCHHVLRNVLNQDSELVWHRQTDLAVYDAIVVPGGFSYGDYLRCGAIARFSPVMEAVKREADRGKLIFGSCNGFQILCEAGLLPGALMRNAGTQFRCQPQHLRVETTATPFTNAATPGEVVMMPVSHGEGNYYVDQETLSRLEAEERVVFRYCDETGNVTPEANPNGSLSNIAGVVNEGRNVLGMMPHPERASEALLGGTDGLLVWTSMLRAMDLPLPTAHTP